MLYEKAHKHNPDREFLKLTLVDLIHIHSAHNVSQTSRKHVAMKRQMSTS